MELKVKRTKDGRDIVDVIIKEDPKTNALVIFFPMVRCKFGMIFGYSFNDLTHKEYFMAQYESMPGADMFGLAICLYQATSPRKAEVEFRVVKKDCALYQRHRWGEEDCIELLCGEHTSKSGRVSPFFTMKPTIYSQDWYDDLTTAQWSKL